ncbi:MAG: hypothetical protein P8R54_07085 [Myxococcota bacterium]|nr:hypothetical protein [Myxococcota bacterium]
MSRLLALLLIACGDKAACPDGFVMGDDGLCLEVSDTDTAVDSETDCIDGVDNDRDGLTDCEDDECLDFCLEDCTDGMDNDRDGLTDCADDECYGEGDCGGPYTVSMATAFTPFPGYNYPMYFGFGASLQTQTGQGAILSANASIELVASPDGWAGEGFSCAADLYLLSYGSAALGDVGMTYQGASDGTVDYAFTVSPSTSDGSLTWKGSCPMTTLPSWSWGFYTAGNTIARADASGSWVTPWYAANVTSVFYGAQTTIALGELFQYAPAEWTGVY